MVFKKQLTATLTGSMFKQHSDINRRYLLSLEVDRMLANFMAEAGLNSNIHTMPLHYGGWEHPHQQVRGDITGHWLSACSMYVAYTNDQEMRGRMIKAIDILELCQTENEDGWLSSIPSLYLDRIARNKWVWAPTYNLHKTLMGLIDAYRYAGIEKALSLLSRMADWFLNWTDQFSEEKMQDILDWESGGIMESWADLYGLTGDERYKTLMERFAHFRFFNPLLEGKDILTHTHANTTIPEAHGMARAYQVTGEEKYRVLAEGYLDQALNGRDWYCTCGQNAGESWLCKLNHSDIGGQLQEHCTVYNMIRLCEYVMTWNADVKYAEFIERNIYNGLMAQHRLSDGMNAYYLPLGNGYQKKWTTPENDMTCCLGTTMQANASYETRAFFESEEGLVLSQYIPAVLNWEWAGKSVEVALTEHPISDTIHRPVKTVHRLTVRAAEKTAFTLTVRIPGWSKETVVTVNGKEYRRFRAGEPCWLDIPGEWQEDVVEILVEPTLTLSQLGETDYYAVLYGPTVLVGLTDDDRCLRGLDQENICEMVRPRASHDWNASFTTWETDTDSKTVVMRPIYDITDESYTVYFKK